MHEITDPDPENEFSAALNDEYGAPSRCNEFAFRYLRTNDDVVVKVGRVGDDEKHGDYHCWAYDRARDRTVDLTMRQFDGFEDLWTGGEDHPHCTEIQEFEDHGAFVDEWDFGMDSPFHIQDARAAV